MPRGLLPQYGKKIYGTYTHMQVLSALLSVLYDLHNSKKLKYNKTKRDSIESNNLSENKKERTQINNKNKRKDIITSPTNIKSIQRDYHENFHANKLDYLYEINCF